MIQHIEIPKAPQIICVTNSQKENLNKENTIADIKSDTAIGGWWMVDGTYQCYGRKIIRKHFFKKKIWNCKS